jgi:hypothetical protein
MKVKTLLKVQRLPGKRFDIQTSSTEAPDKEPGDVLIADKAQPRAVTGCSACASLKRCATYMKPGDDGATCSINRILYPNSHEREFPLPDEVRRDFCVGSRNPAHNLLPRKGMVVFISGEDA